MLQRARNHWMHSLNGNPQVINLEMLLFPQPTDNNDISISQPTSCQYSIADLLHHRTPQVNSSVGLHLPKAIHLPKVVRGRTGRRRSHWTYDGKVYFRRSKNKSTSTSPTTPPQNSYNSLPKNSSQISLAARQPAPPPRGAPGATQVANEECSPTPLAVTLVERGSPARRIRRQLYRNWRKRVQGSIPWCRVGSGTKSKGQPTRAVRRPPKESNASQFRRRILQQPQHFQQQGASITQPYTPPLTYGSSLKVGELNVQGMADPIKHTLIKELMVDQNLDILFLTETRSTSYHSFQSGGFLFIINGSHQDKFAGVSAVLSPQTRSHLKCVQQISPRLLHLVLRAHSGDHHFIGAYAPHAGLDFHRVREPFWVDLEKLLSCIPMPQPVFILGDFNIRLQGRRHTEGEILGPFVFGKGKQFANTEATSNRTLYLNFLQQNEACDVMTHKTGNPLHQISFKDKAPPPIEWSQFIFDPLVMQQVYAKFQTTFGDDALEIAYTIRSYLNLDRLPPPTQQEITPDFRRFQCLDRLVTRRQWLNTIHSCKSMLRLGFPSDHFLIVTSIRVKLAARKITPRTYKIQYDAMTPADKQSYCDHFLTAAKQQKATDHANHTEHISASLDHTASSLVDHTARSRQITDTLDFNLNIYVQGSGGQGNRTGTTQAGWGFVAEADGDLVEEAKGPVVTDVGHYAYVGAGVRSTNAGQLTSWIEAALWVLAVAEVDKHIPAAVTFMYNSNWVAQMVRGKWKPQKHKAMVAYAKQLLAVLCARTTVHWTRTTGNPGHNFTQLADTLAARGKTSASPEGGRHENKYKHISPDLWFPQNDTPLFPSSVPTAENLYLDLQSRISRARVHVPNSIHAPQKPWITPDTMNLIVRAKHLKIQDSPEHKNAYTQAKRAARKDKVKWLQRQLMHHPGHVAPWKVAKRVRKGFVARNTRLVIHGKAVPWSQTHKAMRNHLHTQQWGPSSVTRNQLHEISSLVAHPPQNAFPPPFTLSELQEVIHRLQNAKAPGPDAITNEDLALISSVNPQLLLDLVNAVWEERKVPSMWKSGIVVPIYKGKGDESNPCNYRPISLLNTPYKLFAAMLHARVAQQVEARLRQTQYGFRSGRGTWQPLFILRRYMDWARHTGHPAHMVFLDWQTAFDAIDHTALLLSLEKIGIHPVYLEIISSIYSSPDFIVKGMNGAESWGTVHRGIRQGCPLSPYLFLIALSVIFSEVDDQLLKEGVPTNTWSVGKPVYDLEYADDTLLMASSARQLQAMVQTLENKASKYGLTLNKLKTVYLTPVTTPPTTIFFADQSPIPVTDCVKYLGSLIEWGDPSNAAITGRAIAAEQAFKSLQQVWKSPLPNHVKLNMFHTVVVPTLMYGLETLTLDSRHFKRIDGIYFRLLRRVTNIKASYYSRVSNEQVWSRANRPIVPSQRLLSQQFKHLLTVLMAPNSDPLHHVVFSPALRDRIQATGAKRGRPTKYWLKETESKILQVFSQFHPQAKQDLPTLKKKIHQHPSLLGQLQTAPTRAPQWPNPEMAEQCAWQA